MQCTYSSYCSRLFFIRLPSVYWSRVLFCVCAFHELPWFWHHSLYLDMTCHVFARIANSKIIRIPFTIVVSNKQNMLTDSNFLWLIMQLCFLSIKWHCAHWTTIAIAFCLRHIHCVQESTCLFIFLWKRMIAKRFTALEVFNEQNYSLCLFESILFAERSRHKKCINVQAVGWFATWRIRSPSPTCSLAILIIPLLKIPRKKT